MTPLPSAAEIRARLDAIRESRGGYLLPHHGPLVATLPDLHAAYEAMYRALTLDQRHLPPKLKEFVWLAILACREEVVGTHHLDLFLRHGGTDAEADIAFRLAAWARGAPSFAALAGAWQRQLPGLPLDAAYHAGVAALLAGSGVPEAWARLALVGAHTTLDAARDHGWSLAEDLVAAHRLAVPEPEIAEAMSLAIWVCGVNPYVRAADCWLGLIRQGRVSPSPAFLAWAETRGQGAFTPKPSGD